VEITVATLYVKIGQLVVENEALRAELQRLVNEKNKVAEMPKVEKSV
jgi:hypothetical protein